MRNKVFFLIFASNIYKMANNSSNLVRFDWAIKHLLRDKANYVVLEGFLSVLLEEEVKIRQILSSQGNKETDDDKYNDVDILVENTKRELIIIEVQNTKEYDYFHRILYGTSKVIAEYIKEGRPYGEVKKVISITIAYFDLGQGEDYVYHGTTNFQGIHKGDLLTLSEKQVELYNKQKVAEIYLEYWIIKAEIFDEEKVNDKLDEWIFFFKTGEVKDEFSAPGLSEAKVKLNKLKLKPKERKAYEAYLERLRKLASNQFTQIADAQDLIKQGVSQGEENKETQAIIGFYDNEVPIPIIAKSLKISEIKVLQIIEAHKKS
jgi:predicted transposase/invertase (TIGR01784 family)